MPTYVYQVVNEDGSDGETFEVFQKMSDPPLKKHPESGKPVRRVPVAPNIGGDYTDASNKNKDFAASTSLSRSVRSVAVRMKMRRVAQNICIR